LASCATATVHVSSRAPGGGVQLGTVLAQTGRRRECAGGQSCAATLSACAAGTWRLACAPAHERSRRPCAALAAGVLAARELPPGTVPQDAPLASPRRRRPTPNDDGNLACVIFYLCPSVFICGYNFVPLK
jgi:hypothetical protein